MSSSIPPNPWFSTINFNEAFFTSNTQTITLAYANATYLRRIGIATSVASLTTFNGDVGVNGTMTTAGLIDASTANFSGQVNFNSIVSPPHCLLIPSADEDLCNKLYVDSQAALTAYQLYLNYSASAPAPVAAYKTLSQTQVPTPSTFPFTISAIGSQLIDGFFNTLVNINVPTTIPAGVWTLLCFCNLNSTAYQGSVGLFYTISSYDAIGTETLVYTSPVSVLINVTSPLIGTSSVSGTFPATTLAVGSIGIGLKLYIVSNTASTRTGNIFFQNASEYSSILTSFAVQQAPDLLNLNNIWTGTNSFTAATTTAAINGITTISTKSLSGTTVVGNGAYSLLAGTNNTLVGSNVGTALTTGSNNAFFGQNIATAATTFGDNTAIGNASCRDLTTGIRNACLGLLAGATITNQSNNTCLGYSATVGVGVSQSTAIGVNSIAATSNTIQLGRISENVNCPNTLSVAANITSSGTGVKFIADFTPSISVNSLKFQNTTIDTGTIVCTIPNGIGTQSGMRYFNNSDITADCCNLAVSCQSLECSINSNITGLGPLLPLNMKIAGTTKLSIATTGIVTISDALTANANIIAAGVAAKFQADFSNGVSANTFKFQGAVAGPTIVGILPNTNPSSLSGIRCFGGNDATNTSHLTVSCQTSGATPECAIVSSFTGLASSLPINLKIASTTALSIATTGVTTFSKQTLALFGATVTASVTLALPLFNSYLITSALATTITLPANSSVYAGSQLYFRRSGGAAVITFVQSGGGAAMVPIGGVLPAANFTMSAITNSTCIASDGVSWFQMYLQ